MSVSKRCTCYIIHLYTWEVLTSIITSEKTNISTFWQLTNLAVAAVDDKAKKNLAVADEPLNFEKKQAALPLVEY